MYAIDRHDRLVTVNDAWDQFALANEAPELVRDRVVGRWLWDFIGDTMTRHVYAALLVRARDGATPQFHVRCDSPTLRRELELRLTAEPDGAIVFETLPVTITPRPPQALWDRHASRSGLLRTCSWCKRVEVRREWKEAEDAVVLLGLFEGAPYPEVTHGMCTACAERMEAVIAGLSGR